MVKIKKKRPTIGPLPKAITDKVTPEMERLAEKIARIIKGYVHNPYRNDKDHVLKWVWQFKEDDRLFVLVQTYELLSNHYFTKKCYRAWLTEIINHINDKTLLKSSLLNIQQAGNSQKDMVKMFKNIAKGLSRPVPITNDYTKKHFIYLDDMTFTGGRAYSDLEAWIRYSAPAECRLHIYSLCIHSQVNLDLKSKIDALNVKKKIKVNIYYGWKYENEFRHNHQSDVFWPQEKNIIIPAHLDEKRFTPTGPYGEKFWRTGFEESQVFRDDECRDRFEKILCDAGFNIISLCSNPAPSMKPLGYQTYHGLGFGGTVFSYRNCANNTPLAFWWGDPLAEKYHPFSKWYPLLLRKTYADVSTKKV